MLIRNLAITFIVPFTFFSFAIAQHESEEHAHESKDHQEEYSASEVILEHTLDTHDWHITDIPAGKDEEGHTKHIPIILNLPFIFYSSKDGLVSTMDNEGLLEKDYIFYHQKIYALNGPVGDLSEYEGEHGHYHFSKAEWEKWSGEHVNSEVTIVDLSITKTVLQLFLIGLLLVWVFGSIAKAYKNDALRAPKGLQSLLEPIIVFVRDEIAKNYLGKSADKFLPYLLTLFFFIWFSNLFGLLPFNSNIMGNISVTAALAVLTFLITQFNGSKDHWKHVFNTPGVPAVLKFVIPLMPVVELIGLFTKPFALAVRLFANITAGHFMVLGLISLIFILGQAGQNVLGGLAIAPLSIAFTIIIFALEMIVAIVQAYVFTLLTAVFVGMAMETHDDHH